MPYTAEISRSNPSCFIFLVDQSTSMEEPFGGGDGTRRTKQAGVADATNRLLDNLVIKCSKDEGIRDYYQVSVIGYGTRVGSALQGSLAGRELVPISEIEANSRIVQRTREVDDGLGGLRQERVDFPTWIDPIASGGTPMAEALGMADGILRNWIAQHPDCFPPIVINITDGEPNTPPEAAAEALKSIRSSDGNVLLFNIHLSSKPFPKIEYPDTEQFLADEYARLLFRMSSVLPPHLVAELKQEGYPVSDNSRGFVFNADSIALIKFLNIGTRPSNLR